jgi:putative nucleotidyltransferase with HDIG domain
MPAGNGIYRLIYITAVVAVGGWVLGRAVLELIAHPPGTTWLVLLALAALASSFTVKLPSLPAQLSASEAFVCSTVLLFGPAAGAVTVAIDALVATFWIDSRQKSASRVLFNATAPVIAVTAGGAMFFRTSSLEVTGVRGAEIGAIAGPALAMCLTYFVCNAILVAGVIAIHQGSVALRQWRRNLGAMSLNYLVAGSIALFVASYIDQINIAALVIVGPVLLISYATFKTSIGRVEDANRHVRQIGDLYLSTIEALAMAVDAKDQITHGHIRRVQVFATELAKRLGVSDEAQLRGIETAALLHDMGKLAIPEFILNKPGKLTVTEFEKMKRHADIGADLLSSISFPYPVIPIVRHHHENWDGTGYPSQLAGHDIPLGARILSVVDCFDALTSDRPYRPRLSDAESFQIIRERRGWMYDPHVVDTFIEVFPEIAPAAIRAGEQARSLIPTFETDKRPAALEQIRTSAAQSTVLGEFGPAVKHTTSIAQAMEVTFQYVSMLTPATVCGLFSFEPETNNVTCVRSAGDNARLLLGLEFPRGERTTGWVVAHEASMRNSPAALDLEDLRNRFSPPLQTALVAPFVHEGKIIGALSVYTAAPSAATPFSEDHQYALERIAALLGENIDLPRVLGLSPQPALQRLANHHNRYK